MNEPPPPLPAELQASNFRDINELNQKIKSIKNMNIIEDRARKEGSGAPPVIINKGGDTVNNINNTTSQGSGGAGSPSKVPDPWEMFTIGSPFTGAYF